MATIMPILKAGKLASRIDSYRPISLTSCVVKTLERMVANHLQHLMEEGAWICTEQVGFRKHHCCEDCGCLNMSATASSGLQVNALSLRCWTTLAPSIRFGMRSCCTG